MPSRVRILIAVLAGYSALVIAFTYPWIRHPLTAVLGLPGDNWECLWRLWWFKESVLHGHNPFYAPQVFYPLGYNLATGETMPGMMLAGFPLTVVFGEIVAYNFLVLSSFVIAGFGMFLLVRDLTADHTAAVLAGVLFAFAPFVAAHAVGHLMLLGYGWLPWLFFFLRRWSARPARSRYLAAAAIVLAMLGYGSLHLAVIAATALVTWFFLARPPGLSRRRWLSSLLVLACVAGVLLAPVVWFYLHARLSGVATGHWGLRGIRGAPPLAFLLPAQFNPLLGGFTRRILSDATAVENSVTLGTVALLLALWAIATGKGRNRPIRPFAGLAFLGIVVALGPVLMRTSKDPLLLPVSIPGWLRNYFNFPVRLRRLPVPLPASVLALLPVFSGIRAYQRFALLANLGTAALAGCGYHEFRSRLGPRWRIPALLVICSVMTLELMRWPFPVSFPRPRPVDLWLADQPGRHTILELPVESGQSGPELYYSRFHGKQMAFGYTSFYPPEYVRRVEAYSSLPESAGLVALRQADVRFVLVNEWADTTIYTKRLMASPAFRLDTLLDKVRVFSVIGYPADSLSSAPMTHH